MTKRPMDISPSNGGSDYLVASQSPPSLALSTEAPSSINGGLINNNNNEAKRAKLERVAAPSRVIHLRNIPADVSEAEVVHLGIPFGRVTNVLVLKGKNQAFLEMEDESAASAMVDYFSNCTAQLRDRPVYVQFSNHKELKTDQTHSNSSASAQAALQAASVLAGQDNMPKAHMMHVNNMGGGGSSGGANTVLRVIVDHMVYPVTLDVMHQIFSRIGKVLKIVTFTKNNTFQALIQYMDVITAQAAKLSLDGQNIYNGCCTLRIEYSKLSNLNVKYNNDKSRDYTNPSLPTGDTPIDPTAALQLNALAAAGGPGGVLGGTPFSAAAMAAAASLAAAGGGGHLGAFGSPAGLASGMAGLQGGAFALGGAGGGPAGTGGGGAGGGSPGPHAGFGQGSMGALRFTPAAAAAVAAGQMNGVGGSVLLVSNLDESKTECDHLFTLFGVYGDVQRVKILFNKKDTALVQLAEPQQAVLAMNHLDKVKLWSKPIRVMPSKHMNVQLPKEGQPDAGLTKDYSQSALHRFKKPGSKNYSNIYPPSATLHLSNIPAGVSEEDLRLAFDKIGLPVVNFKFFPKDRKMALVQMASVDDAVAALVQMHNYQLSETSHLRVSFSKSTI